MILLFIFKTNFWRLEEEEEETYKKPAGLGGRAYASHEGTSRVCLTGMLSRPGFVVKSGAFRRKKIFFSVKLKVYILPHAMFFLLIYVFYQRLTEK